MPRTKSKDELLMAGNKQFEKLWVLIDSMTEEEKLTEFKFEDRDRNIKDVLTHLYEWHKLLLKWIKNNLDGKNQTFLPGDYNWRTYPKLNVEFLEKHTNTSHEDAVSMVKDSHEKVMILLEQMSNEELFTKQHFKWTGSTSLGSYCVSCTSSHYDWAMKKIKKHIKS